MLALMGIFSIAAVTSCRDRNDDVVVQENVPAVMKDVRGSFTSPNGYGFSTEVVLNNTDVVLVYRDVNKDPTQPAYWQLLPKTEYLSGGKELDYNFNFDINNVDIFTVANFDYALLTGQEVQDYLSNQRFRIVLIPAMSGKNTQIDYNDYKSVLKFYNIKDRP